MLDFLKNNPLVEGARTARLKPRMAAQFLIFFLVMTVAEMIANIPVSLYSTVRIMTLIDPTLLAGETLDEAALLAEMDRISAIIAGEDLFYFLSLFSMGAVILVSLFYCRVIERRPLASMGVTFDRKSLPSLLLGLLFGLLMLGSAFLISYGTGAVTVAWGSADVKILILSFLAYLVVGSAEEFLCRGYLMPSLCNATSPISAILISALFFSLMHISNPGFSAVAALNIFLFGILLGFLVLRTGNIWIACGLHAAWNFTEGALFGMPISGTATGRSLLVSTLAEGRVTTNGGEFGPEGGVAVTVILLLAFILFLYWPQSTKIQESVNNEPRA